MPPRPAPSHPCFLPKHTLSQILGAVRTEHISAHLLSVCLSDKPPRRGDRDLASRRQVKEKKWANQR